MLTIDNKINYNLTKLNFKNKSKLNTNIIPLYPNNSKNATTSQKSVIDKILNYFFNNPFFKLLDKICGI